MKNRSSVLGERLDAAIVGHSAPSEIVQPIHDVLVGVGARHDLVNVRSRVTGFFRYPSNITDSEFTIDHADLLHVRELLVARGPVGIHHHRYFLRDKSTTKSESKKI